jgi:hypothetical protein
VEKQFHEFYVLVENKKFPEAELLLQKLKDLTDENYSEIIDADMVLKREKYRDLHKKD